jgi:hypothetical protein
VAAGSTYGGHTNGPDKPGFNWTPALQQQFREQFEKMIILDYLIRNTGTLIYPCVLFSLLEQVTAFATRVKQFELTNMIF